jgi:hypothetical protein
VVSEPQNPGAIGAESYTHGDGLHARCVSAGKYVICLAFYTVAERCMDTCATTCRGRSNTRSMIAAPLHHAQIRLMHQLPGIKGSADRPLSRCSPNFSSVAVGGSSIAELPSRLLRVDPSQPNATSLRSILRNLWQSRPISLRTMDRVLRRCGEHSPPETANSSAGLDDRKTGFFLVSPPHGAEMNPLAVG